MANPENLVDSLLPQINHNPDVLSCLANLSNDEVFTPPPVANAMLDMLPQELFTSPDTKFLDPACKSGVFLREIVKRLMYGLEEKFPDQQKRLDHILHHQVYGIAITELTSLLSRRTLYCAKYPNCPFSISHFDNISGNIRHKAIQHTWKNGKCVFCGASQAQYERGEGLETHAYEFIHMDNPQEIFGNMKFDVIIGNPPYQLATGGSVESQATPIYNEFILKSIKLNPNFLTMVTPSRWFNGGFGLDKFRNTMLNDKHIKVFHDFIDANLCFPGIQIKGGVNYFLWDKNYNEKCNIYTHYKNTIKYSQRYLLEEGLNTFIRWNEAVSILNKVNGANEESFSNIVSPRDPFGLNYYENGREIMFKNFTEVYNSNSCKIYYQGWAKKGLKYIQKNLITTRQNLLNTYKVFISKAYGASEDYPHQILNTPILGAPNTCCSMTYLVIENSLNTRQSSLNIISYIQTKFFRFLVAQLKNTQNAYKQVYRFVPLQDFSKPWTDAELYEKYNLSQEEIDFIESMIKPMDLSTDTED